MLLEIVSELSVSILVLAWLLNLLANFWVKFYIEKHVGKQSWLIWYAEFQLLSDIADKNSNNIEIVQDVKYCRWLLLGSYAGLVVAAVLALLV